MKAEARHLLRDELDRRLAPLRRARLVRPRRGWVHAVREALGMNGRQLSERLGIARAHLAHIEDAEVRGAATLHTLEKAADALGCDLVYAFVPHDGKTLELMLRERAREVAERIVGRVATTMALEAQGVDRAFRKKEVDRVAADLVRTLRKHLWDE